MIPRPIAALTAVLLACAMAPSLAAQPAAAAPEAATGFAGNWDTTYGLLVIEQEGAEVTGSYSYGGGSTIEGTVSGSRLRFRYHEPSVDGEGWFELSEDGQSISGSWREEGATMWYPWSGTRTNREPPSLPSSGFRGLFETTYGRLRLTQTGDTVVGQYSYGGGATVTGTVSGNRLTFRYQEPTVAGEGWFQLNADESTFDGQWREDGSSAWAAWSGERVVAEPGKLWLVVLEAPWETSIAENEYSFGDMLRTYFERMPHVEVRHRRVYDRADFVRAAGELGYLAEPVALLIASHGSGGQLTVNQDVIGPADIGAALAGAPNVFAIHFSACDIMVGTTASEIRAALPPERTLAISGYATSVDWSASALIEFLYLDLILGRGMSPALAAQIVRREMTFAGDTANGSALGPAMFRFVE